MERYESFDETISTLCEADKANEEPATSQLPEAVDQKGGRDIKQVAALCKKLALSLACALSLCLKSAFEEFARQDRTILFGFFPVELYKLAEPAGRFEIFSPAIDEASAATAEAYGMDTAQVSAQLTSIIHNRFYLYDAAFFKDKLDALMQKELAADAQCDADKKKSLLREKISLEKSCEIKSYHLLEAKAMAVQIRLQFLAMFPEYRKEFTGKTKAEILGAIEKKLESGEKIDDAFLRKLAELLCIRAGIERDMKNELDAAHLERFICRSPMDQELANHFHNQVTSEITALLKYAHPDKWNPDASDEDLQKQIAEKTRELVRFKELSRLGPGIMTFKLVSELQSWKKEFALLNPEASREMFRKEAAHPLEMEVKFWEASEQYLSTELEAILGDQELQNMRVILDAPDMQEEYGKSLRKSITALTHRIEQRMADPAIREQWDAVIGQARSLAGNTRMIEELYE